MSRSIASKCLAKLGALSGLLAAILYAAPSQAGTFAIDPTRLSFSTMTSGDVAITNVGQTAVRLSVHAYEWSQDVRTPEKLLPSRNVVYFPQLFTLTPGATQRVRVGVLDAPTATERAYRLIVNELPAFVPHGAAGTAGVNFLSRVDIPVLLAPTTHGGATPELRGLTVREGTVDVVLANTGATHIEQSRVSIAAHDANGAIVWQTTANAFYVLAHSQINVTKPIPARQLRRAASMSITWHAPGFAAITRSYPLR